MEKEVIYIGMDLGTFKTSVASSNGMREHLYTAVGWPKDYVARRALGREVVFGEDTLEQAAALHVIRPFEKGVLKYLDQRDAGMPDLDVDKHKKAAQLLVEYAVALTNPPKGVPIYGVIGAPSRARLANKQVLLEVAQQSFDALAIVSEPFAVAYGMNHLVDTLLVDLGAGTVDICPMCGSLPSEEMQLTLPIGGDFIDEAFLQRLREVYPEAQVSRRMAREIKEKFGFVHDLNEKVIVTLNAKGKPRPFDVTGPLKDACKAMARQIVQGLCELSTRLDSALQDRLFKHILLCGGGSQLQGLDRFIENGLREYGGGNVTRVADAVFAGAFGALKLAINMPAEYWSAVRRNPVRKAA